MLKRESGMDHGDANTLVHSLKQAAGERAVSDQGAAGQDVLTDIYSGHKAALHPIHEALMAQINVFGEFDIAPKKDMSACGARSNLP